MIAMGHACSTVALFMGLMLGGSLACVACSDTDPKYGPPEAIRGRKIDYGVEAPATEPADGGGGTTGGAKTPQQLFNDVYATITGTGEGTKCTPCHAPGGIGVTLFVGTGAPDAYTIFKSKGYQDLTKPNAFYTKGQHSAAPLTAAQQALTKAWSDAEAAGGAAPPADAGGD
jgi:hypothetical protein